jgi:hypothetical protein
MMAGLAPGWRRFVIILIGIVGRRRDGFDIRPRPIADLRLVGAVVFI